ncbi:MAG: S9 family peptidase [Candidatus Dormiibacterota bacterium]
MPKLSLESFNELPRVNGLLLSPDGRQLVLQVQTRSPDRTRFTSSLWGAPADGSTPPRRLTFSEQGEGAAGFLPDGSLVFASARPDVTVKEDQGQGRLFLLPTEGGEARPLTTLPGGAGGLMIASDAPTVAVASPVFPTSAALGEDAEKQKQRKEAGVTGVLLDEFPIRYWDHDLGPRHTRLLRLQVDPASGVASEPEDLTPAPGVGLGEASFAISPDGRTVVTTWRRDTGNGILRTELFAIEGGTRRALASGADFAAPAISPDGSQVVVVREEVGTPDRAGDLTLWLVDLASGEGRDLLPGFDLWPAGPTWSADGASILFVADERGRAPVYEVPVAGGTPRRRTEEGAFSSLRAAADGSVYALRSSYLSPNEVVRIASDGAVTPLPTPGLPLELPGTLTELEAAADDGVPIRAWLALPEGASESHPAPLVLWVHGGPLSSWNSWSWRWCPWLLTERGYAVLLPDPALSTGYGLAMVQRAWGRWGPRVLDDLHAITDAALRRDDLDASRTAAMGGSFGGYMANWIAGHTDRFRAIVSHAGLWDLEQFHGTTDVGPAWEEQFGDPYTQPERYREYSPRRAIEEIRTPMLVIHGNRDYRVPIGEALRLWTDLRRHGVEARYLTFPDENHWILTPGNARVWYETALAFLAEHVLDEPWERPALL